MCHVSHVKKGFTFTFHITTLLSLSLTPDKHKDGVGDEVGSVQDSEHGLGLVLLLAVDLGDPGDAAIARGAVQELPAVLHDGQRLPGGVVGGVGQEGEQQHRHPEHAFLT